MSKLNERSLWLLRFLTSKFPLGYATHLPLPSDTPLGLSMKTIRGLEKRGFCEERAFCVYFVTQKGKEYVESLNKKVR